MASPLRDLMVAFMFLTRLPIRTSVPWQQDDLAASVLMFPVVGAAVGLIGALAYALASSLGLPPYLAATITLTALVLITGALHEDGIADVADGFGGGNTKADKLTIMRDSRLGSYGALALVLALIARLGCLTALASPWTVAAALVAASTISRAAMPIAMVAMAQAREDGLAAKAGRPHSGRIAAAVVIALLIASLCLPWEQMVTAFGTATLVGGLLLILANRQIGGITGDVLGALQQVTEIAWLLTMVSLSTTGPWSPS